MPRPISYAVFCLKKKKTYQAGLRRDAVKPDIEAERKKRDEIEASKTYCNRPSAAATYDLSLHDALPIFLTASKQFRHGATSKSRSNTASNSTKHKSPHLSGWRQIISLIT